MKPLKSFNSACFLLVSCANALGLILRKERTIRASAKKKDWATFISW